jgi:vacuolar-type H+-ATPase catalytic subunit A/Vma1
MSQFWKDIFQYIGSPLVIIGAVTYLLRKFLDLSVESKLEEFKIILQADADKKLFEYQTTFATLHQKRSDLIAELYKQLSITYGNLCDLTQIIQFAGGPTLPEKKKTTRETFNNLSSYFSQHRIYFSVDLCNKMETVIKMIKDAFIEFDTAHTYGMQNSSEYTADHTGLWVKSWEKVTQEIPPVLNTIEEEFRSLLNVKEPAA